MKTTYRYEMTDTFNGEANYSWVTRGTITTTARNPVRAVKRALGMENVRCRREELGETLVLYPAQSCTVVFIDGEEN